MNCRGNETRKRIITEYIVEPKAHLKLLANQRKNSDAKAIIEDEYYIFTAVRKRDGKEEIIQCGMGAARDFLKLLNHPGLPLFNPLKTDSTIKKDDNQKSNSQEIKVEKWNKTAKQLYNAIMWLITIWDAQPNTPLFEFRDEIVKYKENNPYDSKIKRINTAVKNGGKGKKLTEMIEYIKKSNCIRDNVCNFDLLIDRVNKMYDNGVKVESYF